MSTKTRFGLGFQPLAVPIDGRGARRIPGTATDPSMANTEHASQEITQKRKVMTQQEEIEKALQRVGGSLAPWQARVLESCQRARRKKPGELPGFYQIVDRLYGVFRSELGRATSKVAAVLICQRYTEEFTRLDSLPPEQRGPLAHQAGQERLLSNQPAPVGFDAAAYVMRLSSRGISLSASPSGEILVRGKLHQQVRDEISHRKNAILAYLRSPAQIVA